MKTQFRRRLRLAIASLFLAASPAVAYADDEGVSFVTSELLSSENPLIRQVSHLLQPATTGEQPQDFTGGLGGSAGRQGISVIETPGYDLDVDAITIPQLSTAPNAENVTAGELAPLAPTDLLSALNESPFVQTLHSQQRSPVSFDPRIRGYRLGQYVTGSNGEFWMPVRNDLDTPVTRIDPSLVKSVEIIAGPYSAQYGPGFAFLNIDTALTSRYQDGFEVHNRAGFTSRFNGGQVYGRDVVYGGNDNYGFYVGYSKRTGSDYSAGNGWNIPSSYADSNLTAALGFDFGDDRSHSLEFRFSRLEQSNTEYAAQFFDINFLGSQSYSVTYLHDDCVAVNRVDAWYNRTAFSGDTLRAGKYPMASNPSWHVIDRVNSALTSFADTVNTANANNPNYTPIATPINFAGYTNGDITSTGTRALRTWGDPQDVMLRMGTDVRLLVQRNYETFDITDANGAPVFDPQIATNQPRSLMVNPGLFTEFSLPWHDLVTTVGGRLDYAATAAQRTGGLPDGVRTDTSLAGAPDSLEPQGDMLYSIFATERWALSHELVATAGVGLAQRLPTLTDRYADGQFLSLMQSGFNRVIGNPYLQKETALQADLGLNAKTEYFTANVGAFYSWIDNYVTYAQVPVTDPTGARILYTTNTGLATLKGLEASGEVPVRDFVSLFGNLMYVSGTDESINQPLFGIYPLQGQAGLRFKSVEDPDRWGMEFGARMAADQNRLGAIRNVFPPNNGPPYSLVETRTPGYTVSFIRGFYNVTDNLFFTAGVDNLFDRNYYDHLSLRLPADGAFPATRVLSPGITPYLSVEWTY